MPAQRIGLHTRLRAGAEADYVDLHRQVPHELTAAIRDAGVHEWLIFRDGLDLFHSITVDDYDAAIAQLAELAVNQRWQATVGQFTKIAHDYSGAANDRMSIVFDLSSSP